MTYKIKDKDASTIPSIKAYKEEIADFWEIQALIHPNDPISLKKIGRILSIGLDEINNSGLISEDEAVTNKLQETFNLLEERKRLNNNIYPFEINHSNIELKEECSPQELIYLYLLLCTRLNMKTDKVANDIDGTLVFEELCAVVIKEYFGPKSESLIFGTSNPGNFEDKINELIKLIGEGKKFRNINPSFSQKNDDGLDIVVWIDFYDKDKGKFIGFGQCKTGTNWRETIHKLRPGTFCESWFEEPVILKPIPIIFISDTMDKDRHYITDQQGYLIFNRYRIIQNLPLTIPHDLITKIKQWISEQQNTLLETRKIS